MTTDFTEKNGMKYLCEKCDYTSKQLSDYNRHINTRKHRNRTDLNYLEQKKLVHKYTCLKCNKTYKARNSLLYHEKTCSNIQSTDTSKDEIISSLIKENSDFKNLILEVVKSNNELQKQVLDVCKNIQPSVITNSNNNNKTFNLHFFLNEQCKDAMNISEFINSVTLSVKDLERVGTLGYVEGISSIIIKQLGNLDIHKRPMHCSDTKRETLYIKDENKWEKEDQENKKIKNVIKSVEYKNLKMINEWTKEHPNYKESKEKDNDTYLKILMEATGSPGNYEDKGNKIIKKIAKAVAIEKDSDTI